MAKFLPVKTKSFLTHTMEKQGFSYRRMGNLPSLAKKVIQVKDQFNERKVTTLKFSSILLSKIINLMMEMVERCLLMIIKQSKVSRGEKKTYDIKQSLLYQMLKLDKKYQY